MKLGTSQSKPRNSTFVDMLLIVQPLSNINQILHVFAWSWYGEWLWIQLWKAHRGYFGDLVCFTHRLTQFFLFNLILFPGSLTVGCFFPPITWSKSQIIHSHKCVFGLRISLSMWVWSCTSLAMACGYAWVWMGSCCVTAGKRGCDGSSMGCLVHIWTWQWTPFRSLALLSLKFCFLIIF